ncbi:MAG: hypothetical protein FJW40_14505 [Acidobacteria bacterium]|nr:hypothetical protein [Acidobacteriota bacterium]
MRVTAASIALLAAALNLGADARGDVREALAEGISGFATQNPDLVTAMFSQSCEDREAIISGVRALIAQADVSVSLTIPVDTGDESERRLTIDLFLEIKSREAAPRLVRRREVARVTWRREGRRWRIVAFDKPGLFAPAF